MTENNCYITATGTQCPKPSNYTICRPWDFTVSRDQCYIDSLGAQALDIAGAQVNVYKLLGVHEQTKLLDLTGDGDPISGGDALYFPASNAFTIFAKEWRSKQTGQQVLTSAYIGYDFGFIKISTGRQRYGIDTSIRNTISTIKIKQSNNQNNRVTKARIERSEDGKSWYGVAIVHLPDNDLLNTIHFKASVPARYWRLRPLEFAGQQCDYWGVQALEMSEYEETALNNIEDKIFLENRNRDYNKLPITLKGFYTLSSISSDLTKFGIQIPTATYQITINFNRCVALLGRPVVVGDIIELPSETQYTPDLKPIKRYLEVTDVTWDPGSYTPGWQPTMLLVTAVPAMASQETQDIFGDLRKNTDASGLFDNDDGNHPKWQDYSEIDQTIQETSLSKGNVPQRGSEGSNVVREFTEEEITQATADGFPNIQKIGFTKKSLYVEDAIPQNNAPYTEGPEFPSSPSDGDYHRMTYEGLSKDVPARLYRWSTLKGRWVYLETDRRQQFNYQKEVLNEYLTNPQRIPANKIGE